MSGHIAGYKFFIKVVARTGKLFQRRLVLSDFFNELVVPCRAHRVDLLFDLRDVAFDRLQLFLSGFFVVVFRHDAKSVRAAYKQEQDKHENQYFFFSVNRHFPVLLICRCRRKVYRSRRRNLPKNRWRCPSTAQRSEYSRCRFP